MKLNEIKNQTRELSVTLSQYFLSGNAAQGGCPAIMGPNKMMMAEEGHNIKKLLEFLLGEISIVKTQQKAILDLVEDVKVLLNQNTEKYRHPVYLENRIAELEQDNRMNNVLLTRLRVKPPSYSQAVTTDNGVEPGEQDISSVDQQVAVFLLSKGIEVDCNNIEVCHYSASET